MCRDDSIADRLAGFYRKLQDQESRDLFHCRLGYLLDGKEEELSRLISIATAYQKKACEGSRYRYMWDYLDDEDRKKEPLVLYGAGGMGVYYLDWIRRNKLSAVCFCDGDAGKWGGVFQGLPIISPEELVARYGSSPLLIAANALNTEEILRMLHDRGFPERNVYRWPPDVLNQYFCPPIIRPGPDEVYVDAGCFDGYTIQQFAAFCGGGYKKIYGLEPDPESCRNTAERVERAGLQNVELLEKGAWSSSTTLTFDISDRETGSARVADSGGIRVPTVRIDELFPGGSAPPTLIKMDIEGAELAALHGAENVIAAHKPRLAICIYHKPSDILDIPLYLSELVPEYVFHIRHHSFIGVNETVLYAVTERMNQGGTP